jgi:hypothetical protein
MILLSSTFCSAVHASCKTPLYKIPLSVSPNGNIVLFKSDAESDVSVLSLKPVARFPAVRYTLIGAITHTLWSPNSDVIVVFLQPPHIIERSVLLLSTTHFQIRVVPAFHARAEAHLVWNRTGTALAFSDGSNLVLLDEQLLSIRTFMLHRPASLAWATPDKLYAVDRTGIHQEVQLLLWMEEASASPPFFVTELPRDAYSVTPVFNSHGLLVLSKDDNGTTITLMTTLGIPTRSVHFNRRLEAPLAIDGGAKLAVETFAAGKTMISVLDLHSLRLKRITEGYVDNIRGQIGPHRLVFTRRGSSPPILLSLAYPKGSPVVLARGETNVTAHTQIERVTNHPYPVYLWTPHRPCRSLVIRLHGANVRELPVWQPEVEAVVDEGACFVTVDYPDTSASDDIAQRLMALIKARNISLTKDAPVAVLGFSAGISRACTVTASFVHRDWIAPSQLHMFLVGASRSQLDDCRVIASVPTLIYADLTVQDNYRGWPPPDLSGPAKKNLQLVMINDGHLVMQSPTWAAVNCAINSWLSSFSQP